MFPNAKHDLFIYHAKWRETKIKSLFVIALNNDYIYFLVSVCFV